MGNGRTKEAHTCTQPGVTRCNDPAWGRGAQDSQKQEGKCNKNRHLRDSLLCPENAAISLYRSELTLPRLLSGEGDQLWLVVSFLALPTRASWGSGPFVHAMPHAT